MRLQVQHRGAGDVGGHQVGGELDPLELKAQQPGQHPDQRGLADPGNVVDQHVGVREDAGEEEAERSLDAEQSPPDPVGEGLRERPRRGRGRHGAKDSWQARARRRPGLGVTTGWYGRARGMRWGVLTGPRGLRLAVEICESSAERRRGLLGRDRLEPGTGLLITGARSVHTIGMRFPLLVGRMPPGRFALPRPRVRHVLELADRGQDATNPHAGDRLGLERSPPDLGRPARSGHSPRWRAISRRWISDVPE